MTAIPPLRREIHVKTSVDVAFVLFTAHIGAWWPTGAHSVFGAGSLVAFEGDRLVERSPEGTSVWAEVTEWDPPVGFRLSWHPGHDADRATDLRVRFEPAEDETRVLLEHSGWERMEHPAQAAANYGNGWPIVLARFGDRVSAYAPSSGDDAAVEVARDEAAGDDLHDDPTAQTPTGAQEQWYALVHTPGPLLRQGESVFAHVLFAEHLAFLSRLRERGLLVAAGPVDPQRGEGMTIVRVHAGRDDIDVVELATRDDLSVVQGLLAVEVRPWDVRLSAGRTTVGAAG